MKIFMKEFINGFFRGAGAVLIGSAAYYSIKNLTKKVSHKNN